MVYYISMTVDHQYMWRWIINKRGCKVGTMHQAKWWMADEKCKSHESAVLNVSYYSFLGVNILSREHYFVSKMPKYKFTVIHIWTNSSGVSLIKHCIGTKLMVYSHLTHLVCFWTDQSSDLTHLVRFKQTRVRIPHWSRLFVQVRINWCESWCEANNQDPFFLRWSRSAANQTLV